MQSTPRDIIQITAISQHLLVHHHSLALTRALYGFVHQPDTNHLKNFVTAHSKRSARHAVERQLFLTLLCKSLPEGENNTTPGPLVQVGRFILTWFNNYGSTI